MPHIKSTIRERYIAALSFYKLSVFRDDAGQWIRMERGGPWMGVPYLTWEAAMRGEK